VNGDAGGRLDTGGVALSQDFQRSLSINGSISETLIESEYAYSAVGNGNIGSAGDGWADVPVNSWHTKSTGTATTGNQYGNRSATSRAGTQYTYESGVAERSDASGVRQSAWPKIPQGPTRSPYVVSRNHALLKNERLTITQRPAGDSRREMEEAWAGSDEDDSEEKEEDQGDSDDSDGDNTVI
jgi:hypothetical protein